MIGVLGLGAGELIIILALLLLFGLLLAGGAVVAFVVWLSRRGRREPQATVTPPTAS